MKTIINKINEKVNSLRWAVFCNTNKKYIKDIETRVNKGDEAAVDEMFMLLDEFGIVKYDGEFVYF